MVAMLMMFYEDPVDRIPGKVMPDTVVGNDNADLVDSRGSMQHGFKNKIPGAKNISQIQLPPEAMCIWAIPVSYRIWTSWNMYP